MVGAMGGLINYSLRKIIVYSSIAHSGWILTRIIIRASLWVGYFLIYSIIVVTIILTFKLTKINKLNQIFVIDNFFTKFSTIIIFLSLRGLPPFRGFLAKYLIIVSVLTTNFKILIIPIMLSTLIRLFFYIRVVLINITTTRKSYLMINIKINKKTTIINIIGLMGGWFLFLILDFKLKKKTKRLQILK